MRVTNGQERVSPFFCLFLVLRHTALCAADCRLPIATAQAQQSTMQPLDLLQLRIRL
jgi:hypothetical protein